MNDNTVYWIFGVILIAAIIMIFGHLTSRNLPTKQKKNRSQKFAAIAMALMWFSFPLLSPYISSYSRTSYLDELKADNLNSIENIAKFEEEQTRNIERLKSEVQNLRDELYELNQYYRFVIQMFSTMIVVTCILFAFRDRQDEKELETIQSDQISKL